MGDKWPWKGESASREEHSRLRDWTEQRQLGEEDVRAQRGGVRTAARAL